MARSLYEGRCWIASAHASQRRRDFVQYSSVAKNDTDTRREK